MSIVISRAKLCIKNTEFIIYKQKLKDFALEIYLASLNK